MKPEIFLDMDGVIADFFSAYMNLWGLKLSDVKLQKPWPYAAHDWANSLNPQLQMTEKKGAEKIDDMMGFWESIPRYIWTNNLIDHILQKGYGIIICSSPALHKFAIYGKMGWLTNRGIAHLPQVFTNHKYLLGASNRILIDDSDKVIETFEQQGGRGIIFPQPWNKNWEIDGMMRRLEYVAIELERHIQDILNGEAPERFRMIPRGFKRSTEIGT